MNYQDMIQLPYQEFLKEIFREAPQNCTWMKVRNWLDENYSQQQIAEMNAKLYRQLRIFTPDDRVEDPAADDLRDQMDVFCYAGSHELNEKAIRQVINEFTGCDAML